MDHAEQLAAFLAGELDADEHRAVEALLARDPGVRAQLEAMRRADAALAEVPPTPLPDGAEERLRAALAPELATQLGVTEQELRAATADDAEPTDTTATGAASGAGAPAASPGEQLAARDELAVRREQRQHGTPRWVTALGSVAAAVVLVAVVGVGVVTLGSGAGDDAATDGAADTALTMEADGGAGAPETAAPGPGEAPAVVVSDRDLDAAEADALLASDELLAVAERGYDAATGTDVASSWRAGLLGPDQAAREEAEAPTDDAETDAGETGEAGDADLGDDTAAQQAPVAPAPRRLSGEVTEREEADLVRCLGEVLAGGGRAIPTYAEFARFEGEEALVLGLVTLDPATDAYTRPEVWVLAREDCQVLRFSQG